MSIEIVVMIIAITEIEFGIATFFSHTNLSLATLPISLQNVVCSFGLLTFFKTAFLGLFSLVRAGSMANLLSLISRIFFSYFFIAIIYVFALKTKKKFQMLTYFLASSAYMLTSFALMRAFSNDLLTGLFYVIVAVILKLWAQKLNARLSYEEIMCNRAS
jgi:hypothetical protein